MSFTTYIKDALWNLISNKMRSFLSILWIVIGLFSVIFLMSFWTGAQQWIKDQMGSMITNNVTIMPKWWYTQWTDDDVHWYVKAITLTTDLINEIESYFPELTGRVTYGSYSLWMIKNEDDDSLMWQFLWVPADYIDKLPLGMVVPAHPGLLSSDRTRRGRLRAHPRGLHPRTPRMDCRDPQGRREGVCHGRRRAGGVRRLHLEARPWDRLWELTKKLSNKKDLQSHSLHTDLDSFSGILFSQRCHKGQAAFCHAPFSTLILSCSLKYILTTNNRWKRYIGLYSSLC